MGDNLIFKYLDSNLFAIATQEEQSNTLQVYIINGVTGKIAYKFEENRVVSGEPIDIALSENYLVVTFKRAGALAGALPQQEISVTEFYQSKEELDTVKMLKEFYISQSDHLTQHEFSSFDMEAPVVI